MNMATAHPTTPQNTQQKHGARDWPRFSIGDYSLLLEDAEGLVGDQASETAFREVLKGWQQTLELAGRKPFGDEAAEDMSKERLDAIASGPDAEAARALARAIGEFSERLAYVTRQFLNAPSWQGVERIAVGGGFKESQIGRLAMRLAEQHLAEHGHPVALRPLHHAADDGGLVGWTQLRPDDGDRRAFLAVDIGGTNVRCGIVVCDGPEPRVVQREKWHHAEDDTPQDDLVEGIVGMLRRLVTHADKQGIALSPFIGVACPGVIRADGSIERGAQNMPGDWHGASFHLPRRLAENLRQIGDEPVQVLMHNDAVVQGLSEAPHMRDVKRWAVLTIGTGLGNASFTNK
jgi:hypothetical protein